MKKGNIQQERAFKKHQEWINKNGWRVSPSPKVFHGPQVIVKSKEVAKP